MAQVLSGRGKFTHWSQGWQRTHRRLPGQCSGGLKSMRGVIVVLSACASNWSAGRPREDSNLGSRLRRAVLYPLSYGGPDPSSGTESYSTSRTGSVEVNWTGEETSTDCPVRAHRRPARRGERVGVTESTVPLVRPGGWAA